MWTLLLLSAVAVAGPRMVPEQPAAPESGAVGRAAPPFEAPLRDGGTFALEAQHHDDKALILAFWASWCAPCREELPALADLARERDDVTVVAVNVDRSRPAAEAFLRQVPVALPVVWDADAAVLRPYDVTRMPALVLVDDEGFVRLQATGFDRDAVEAALDGLR